MKCRRTALTTILVLLIGLSLAASSGSEQSATGKVPVSIVVSVEGKHGEDSPVLNREGCHGFRGP